MTPVGVLLMDHGTPASLDGVADFYTRIRRGHPPTDDQLAELRSRYEAIGGTSPLTERTRAQADGIHRALDHLAPPGRLVVALGHKHVAPFIEDAATELLAQGATDIIGLVLTPQSSAVSTGEYFARARATVGAGLTAIDAWHDTPGLAALFAAKLTPLLEGGETTVFTAHSVPLRVVLAGDPYPDQVAETAHAVAHAADLVDGSWRVAYQSAGRTPDPWLGPALGDVLDDLASDGVTDVVVSAVGFVADHLEILYDLDIEAQSRADDLGLRLRRTPSLNDTAQFLGLLARRLLDAVPAVA